MKFYLIEMVNYNSDKKDSYAVYSYDSKEEAVQNYHTKMAGAMKNTDYKREQLLIVDSNNSVIVMDIFER